MAVYKQKLETAIQKTEIYRQYAMTERFTFHPQNHDHEVHVRLVDCQNVLDLWCKSIF